MKGFSHCKFHANMHTPRPPQWETIGQINCWKQSPTPIWFLCASRMCFVSSHICKLNSANSLQKRCPKKSSEKVLFSAAVGGNVIFHDLHFCVAGMVFSPLVLLYMSLVQWKITLAGMWMMSCELWKRIIRASKATGGVLTHLLPSIIKDQGACKIGEPISFIHQEK